MNNWKIFTGNDSQIEDDPINRLPPPPPWRDFNDPELDTRRGAVYRPSEKAITMVNVALYLRRPLLITGNPGTGKSSLAFAVAEELKLRAPLVWNVNTRTTVREGLYSYDAIARLQDVQIAVAEKRATPQGPREVARYITLGPLGTALLAAGRPSVLLIDEIDKGDIDLPNDLLHAFEDGEFDIPELTRALESNEAHDDVPETIELKTWNRGIITVTSKKTSDGRKTFRFRCTNFPIIFMTSNGEREFPPAFLRRCLELQIDPPSTTSELMEIIQRHLPDLQVDDAKFQRLIHAIVNEKNQKGYRSVDQFLNASYLKQQDVPEDDDIREAVLRRLMAGT